MRVLVTGGLGVVGSVIVRRLSEAGHVVDVIDACEDPRNHWIAGKVKDLVRYRYETRIENFADYPEKLIADAEAVVHCAASTGIPHSVLNPDDDWQSNVDATRVILEAVRHRQVPTVVLSSVKPYAVPDDIVARGGLREDDPLIPDEPYAASKAAQSMLAMAYARSYGLPIVTFRCSNLYGPAPCHGPRHGWLTWFAISAAIGRPLEVQGTGKQTRDMLHADDVYSACMMAIESADRLKGRVFNLGGGRDNRISVNEAAAEFCAMAGSGEIRTAPGRKMEDQHVFANTSAFLRSTGWHPLVGVREGMRSVFEWARANKQALAKLYRDV